MKRRLLTVLAWLALTPLLVEGGLRLIDPWGVGRYFGDLHTLERQFVRDEHTVYMLPAGHYTFTTWSATELPGSLRLVPDDRGGPCRVLLIGDSVTWGLGVGDAETWANHLAGPDVTILNAAQVGYNSDAIRALPVRFVAADVVIYLVIPNDVSKTVSLNDPAMQLDPSTYSYVRLYLVAASLGSLSLAPKDIKGDWMRFYADLDALATDTRVTFVAFDDAFAHLIAGRYPVHLIPWYQARLSHADAHPSAAGHAEIAAAMLPIVRQAVQNRCTATF